MSRTARTWRFRATSSTTRPRSRPTAGRSPRCRRSGSRARHLRRRDGAGPGPDAGARGHRAIDESDPPAGSEPFYAAPVSASRRGRDARGGSGWAVRRPEFRGLARVGAAPAAAFGMIEGGGQNRSTHHPRRGGLRSHRRAGRVLEPTSATSSPATGRSSEAAARRTSRRCPTRQPTATTSTTSPATTCAPATRQRRRFGSASITRGQFRAAAESAAPACSTPTAGSSPTRWSHPRLRIPESSPSAGPNARRRRGSAAPCTGCRTSTPTAIRADEADPAWPIGVDNMGLEPVRAEPGPRPRRHQPAVPADLSTGAAARPGSRGRGVRRAHHPRRPEQGQRADRPGHRRRDGADHDARQGRPQLREGRSRRGDRDAAPVAELQEALRATYGEEKASSTACALIRTTASRTAGAADPTADAGGGGGSLWAVVGVVGAGVVVLGGVVGALLVRGGALTPAGRSSSRQSASPSSGSRSLRRISRRCRRAGAPARPGRRSP